MTKERTLVTGASSGIGLELARQFAMHGYSLIITARDGAELGEVAREFRRAYGVEIKTIAQDLEKPGGV